MTQITAEVEHQLRQSDSSESPLQGALGDTPRDDETVILQDSNGLVLDRLGRSFPDSPFSLAEEYSAFQRREPLFRSIKAPAGEIVVEVFPIHLPGRAAPAGAASPHPASSRPQEPRLFMLEVALPLKDADVSVLTPIRRNLAINLMAALSLLATVILAALGLRSYVKGMRLEEQVEIARHVQARLLPDSMVQLPGFRIATSYLPSEQVGGDFYDVFPNQQNGFAAVMGDVSGKGVPAALLMGVIHGAVRTAEWQTSGKDHEKPPSS